MQQNETEEKPMDLCGAHEAGDLDDYIFGEDAGELPGVSCR